MGLRDDLGAALVAEALADLDELLADLLEQQLVGGEDRAQLLDQLHELLVLVDDLLALEAGEALQAHVEDRLGLRLGEAEVRHQAFLGLGGLALWRMVVITSSR